MTQDLHFLSSVRRGVTRGIGTVDTLTGPLPAAPALEAWIEVEGTRVARPLALRGPDQVVGLDPSQVLRREPRPDATDVEPNGFVHADLVNPDLPWLFTPAVADAAGRLRPWIVLVVVRRQPGVTIDHDSSGRTVLTITTPAAPVQELPDLSESWAWAHVQSSVPTQEVPDAIDAASADVFARLVCPRQLVANAGWWACLVPALASGVQRGLGDAPDPTGTHEPAWDAAAWPATIQLPVYDMWSFETGAPADFEALARRLRPDDRDAEMGLHAMDVTAPGIVDPAPTRVLLDMEGALLTLGATPRPWPDRHRQRLGRQLRPLLTTSIGQREVVRRSRRGYDPLVEDPVLAPPAWGARAADVPRLPRQGWLPEVNLDPVARSAAGLGAAIVRANAEDLAAAAWDQAGDLTTAMSVVRHGRLAIEIGESVARSVRDLEDADVLQVTRPVQALLVDGSSSVRATLAASEIPDGTFTAAFVRLARPGTTLARDWSLLQDDDGLRLGAGHGATMLAATRADADDGLVAALRFADVRLPDGAQADDPTLHVDINATRRSMEGAGSADRAAITDRLAGTRRGADAGRLLERQGSALPDVLDPRPDPPVGAPRPPIVLPPGSVDASMLAATTRAALRPVDAVTASAVARVPALAPQAANGLPSALTVAPEFPDALFWDLLALSAEWVLPGVSQLGRNRVRLVEVNRAFVGALLLGANTELVRELRWRDYPVDPTATMFRRFWEYVADPDRMDIDPISTWDIARDLTAAMDTGSGSDTMTAVVVRGDVVRRHPDAHWFLRPAVPDGDGDWEPTGDTVEVAFLGSLDDQTGVYGFDLPPQEVRGDRVNGVGGHFIGVEERPGAPRFGLDVARRRDFREDNVPSTWNDASWGHLAGSREELASLSHAPATSGRLAGLELDGATWGHNSAHMAAATWQRPFRLYFHADLVI